MADGAGAGAPEVEGLHVSAVEDGVLTVRLDRPPGNLLSFPLVRALTGLLERPPAGAHVLRVTAAGDSFCLGRERAGTSPGDLRAESLALVGLHRALRSTALVTVAQVGGDAAGFGVGLLAFCDVAVAAEGARLSFPEVTIGLAPAVVLAWLPRVVGEREAFWLTATGEQVPARRAVELGLLSAVAPDREALAAEVEDRIGQLRQRSPRVHADIRSLLHAGRGLSEDQALELSVDRLVVGAQRRGED